MMGDGTSKRRAILVGVNGSPVGLSASLSVKLPSLKYAEEDARELRAVLTDPETGTFDPANVDLLVGADAGSSNVKRTLRRRARETREGDLLLVYYSGHSLMYPPGVEGEVYLATEGLRVEDLDDEPDSGLRMSFLRQDVFAAIEGISLLILDCCASGEYINPRSMSVVTSGHREASRHAALLACSSGALARERDDLGHGEFTHKLLQGLRGDASGIDDEVTLDSLYVWLNRLTDTNPLTDARNWGVHVPLTRPKLPRKRPAVLDLAEGASRLTQVQMAAHHLDGSLPQLRGFLDHLLESVPFGSSDSDATKLRHRVDVLRGALGASAAGFAEISSDSVRFLEWTDGSFPQSSEHNIAELGVAALDRRRQSLAMVGLDSEDRLLYCVPLVHSGIEKVKALIVIHPQADVAGMGESLAVLIKAFLRPESHQGQTVEGLELALLTSLRSTFGRLPYELYEKAFGLYRREIQHLVVVFQSVKRLSSQGDLGDIHSYEALARIHPTHRSAPLELLNVAGIWGDRFIIERDLILAATAIASYSKIHREQASGRSAQPVSINVAVRSLLSPAYIDVVRRSIQDANLEGLVTLEISEQDPIVVPTEMDSTPSPMEAFRRHLIALSSELEVGFAVDDFGVGHSSLDRLAQLSLTQIKIDRAVLEHPLALEELELVAKIAKHTLEQGGSTARTVILEGVDAEVILPRGGGPALTLKHLSKAGIRYLQGYITGDPLTVDLGDVGARLPENIMRGEG